MHIWSREGSLRTRAQWQSSAVLGHHESSTVSIAAASLATHDHQAQRHVLWKKRSALSQTSRPATAGTQAPVTSMHKPYGPTPTE